MTIDKIKQQIKLLLSGICRTLTQENIHFKKHTTMAQTQKRSGTILLIRILILICLKNLNVIVFPRARITERTVIYSMVASCVASQLKPKFVMA
jgi:hypothetical protein